MTERIEKTVFISYRRTNFPWALAVYKDLTYKGYDVFFDYESIKSGDFEQAIIQNIKGRAHFIIILTPSALERCNEPGDWLRREIETALDEKRNIVPLMLEGFDYSSPSINKFLTGKLELIKKYNSLRVPSDFFAEAMARLRGQFLNVPLNTVLHPVSKSTTDIVNKYQLSANNTSQVTENELSSQEWFERTFSLTDRDEKINCLTQAIKLKPRFAEAYYYRGLYQANTNIKKAIQDCTESIRISPDEVMGYIFRANVYLKAGNRLKAKKDLQKAMQIDPFRMDYIMDKMKDRLIEHGYGPIINEDSA